MTFISTDACLTPWGLKQTTIKALRQSIRKWALISVGLGVDDCADNCSLCQLYNYHCAYPNAGSFFFRYCPVWDKVGERSCRDTPWVPWFEHQTRAHSRVKYIDNYKAECGECRTLANKELLFLQSLLEEHLKDPAVAYSEKCDT